MSNKSSTIKGGGTYMTDIFCNPEEHTKPIGTVYDETQLKNSCTCNSIIDRNGETCDGGDSSPIKCSLPV